MARQLKVSVILESIAETQGIQRFNQELRAAEIATKKLKPTLDFVANTMKGVATVGAATAAVFAKGAQASISYASNITDLANASNVSTDAMQVLGHQATLNGASIEDMSKAMILLQSNAADAARGNTLLAEKFARLGIDAQALARANPVEQMERLARAAVKAGSDQESLAAVMDLIGAKNAPKLMASLRDLGDRGFAELERGARSAGVVMQTNLVAKLDSAGDRIEVLKNRLSVFAGSWAGSTLDIIDANTGLKAALNDVSTAENRYGKESMAAVEARLNLAKIYLDQGKTQEAALNLQEANLSKASDDLNRFPTNSIFAQRAARDFDRLLATRRRLAAQLKTQQDQEAAEAKGREAQKTADAVEATNVAGQATAIAENKQLDASVKAFAASLRSKLNDQIDYDNAVQARAAQKAEEADKLAKKEAADREALKARADSLAQSFETPAESATRQLELAGQLQSQNLITAETYKRVAQAANLAYRDADAKRLLASFGPLKRAFNEIQYSISENLTQSLTDFVMTGKLGMKELGQAILRDLVSALIRAQIVMPLMNMIGGSTGLVPGLFSAPAAEGGFRSGSRPYLVGENGPEIFAPGSPGTVIPADETSMMLSGRARVMNELPAPAIIIHNHFATGVTRAELASIIPGIVNQTKAAVADAVRRGGSYRRAYA
jgi:hypothetical protein